MACACFPNVSQFAIPETLFPVLIVVSKMQSTLPLHVRQRILTNLACEQAHLFGYREPNWSEPARRLTNPIMRAVAQILRARAREHSLRIFARNSSLFLTNWYIFSSLNKVIIIKAKILRALSNWMGPFDTPFYYMASSASGREESNSALWLATRTGKSLLGQYRGTPFPSEDLFWLQFGR